ALERIAAVGDDRRQADRVREQARHQAAAAGARDLLGRDQAQPHRRRRPAVRLGIAEADQPGVGGLAIELAREAAGLVPRVDVRRDLALDEAPRAGAERVELGGVERRCRAGVHGCNSTRRWRAATWSPGPAWSAPTVPA